jgi:hypothetical protein
MDERQNTPKVEPRSDSVSSSAPSSPSPTPIQPSIKKISGAGVGVVSRVITALVVAAITGGAGYYFGYKVGFNNGQSSPRCLLCNNGYTPIDEPVIYLYPQKTESVNVQVDYPAGFSYTNPTYSPTSGWKVLASPNGQLTNLTNGKQYSYLVWEGNPPPIKYDMSTGFVVSGAQTESFLHQELAQIGLSPTETDAFIAYWLPKMSGNKYNLIHFAGSEYTDYAKLKVSPQPNSVLRVLMVFQPLQQPAVVKPQAFPGFQRKGFTVVEWGGTEL